MTQRKYCRAMEHSMLCIDGDVVYRLVWLRWITTTVEKRKKNIKRNVMHRKNALK